MAKHAAANNSASALRSQLIHGHGGKSSTFYYQQAYWDFVCILLFMAHQVLDESSPNMPCKGRVPAVTRLSMT